MDCVNSRGTEFFVPFTSQSIDKHVCMPGKQFIDASAWLQELLVMATKGKK